MNFFSVFVYLGYIFLLHVSIFTTINDEKEIFFFGNSLKLLTLDNLNTQKIELHTSF